jgi:hypothetical protein
MTGPQTQLIRLSGHSYEITTIAALPEFIPKMRQQNYIGCLSWHFTFIYVSHEPTSLLSNTANLADRLWHPSP